MDARGQTETLGVVLLLAITVAGVGVVVAAGGSALDTAQDQSAVERAEQSMSLFDARSALVALGRADGQSVSLARSAGGSYEVRPETGRLTVTKTGNNDSTEYVNATLGSVVYEHGDSEIAYQGGGVWRSRGAGSAMVSPPEFNYQGATLTLPVIRVTGAASTASGGPTARVTRNAAESNRSVFPRAAGDRRNPLEGGNVTVAVESEYYRGWASFFRERTTGNVTVVSEENRVELELFTGNPGERFSLEETPYVLRGIAEDDPIRTMTFDVAAKTASGFPNGWSLVAHSGGTRELRVEGGAGNPCKNDDPTVTVTYDGGGENHTWENDSAFTPSGSTFGFDCDGNTPTLALDLTGSTNLTYAGGEAPLSDNSTGSVVNHYVSQVGSDVILEVQKGTGSQNAAGLQFDESAGEVDYRVSSSRAVTYLHISENAVNVTVS